MVAPNTRSEQYLDTLDAEGFPIACDSGAYDNQSRGRLRDERWCQCSGYYHTTTPVGEASTLAELFQSQLLGSCCLPSTQRSCERFHMLEAHRRSTATQCLRVGFDHTCTASPFSRQKKIGSLWCVPRRRAILGSSSAPTVHRIPSVLTQ